MKAIKKAIEAAPAFPTDAIALDQIQSNATFGIYQARVCLNGDDTVYRLILAPEDAPIRVDGIGGAPIDMHFSKPLNQIKGLAHAEP
ncbi:MAG: hypothetical protein ACRCYS_11495 [Beijerinckiaceae bacterium]